MDSVATPLRSVLLLRASIRKQKEKHRDVADAIARFLTKYSETAKDPQAGPERKCSKFSGLGVLQQGSRV